MRRRESGPWVIYQSVHKGVPHPCKTVCEESEWNAIQLASPGIHTLIQSGIATEEEAEKLARGTTGDTPPRPPRKPKTPASTRPVAPTDPIATTPSETP